MTKFTLLSFLVLSNFLVFSQERANSMSIELQSDSNVFQVINEDKKEVSLFFIDKKGIKLILLDDKMQVLDSVESQKPEKSYSRIIGGISENKKTTLFWSSTNYKKILLESFNLEKKETSFQEHLLELKDEVYLNNFSVKNKFLILTLVKNSNFFKLYVFDSFGKLEIRNLDASGLKFYHRQNLYDTLEENFLPNEEPFSLQLINSKNPTSLTETSKKRKCYVDEKQILITIDTDNDFTQLISINLDSYVLTGRTYKKSSYSRFNEIECNSNSFIIDDNLYQIKTSSRKAILQQKDLNDKLIKEYEILEKNPIDFKNTEIIQENGGSENRRILEKTSQFTRKINNLYLGLSFYKVNTDDYMVTIGSVSEVKNNAPLYGQMFGAVGVLAYYMLRNVTLDDFNSYANRKVVYINSLMDKDGNHIARTIMPIAFDKIRDFLKNQKDSDNKTVFKIENSYYLGYYDKTIKKYNILKFTD